MFFYEDAAPFHLMANGYLRLLDERVSQIQRRRRRYPNQYSPTTVRTMSSLAKISASTAVNCLRQIPR